MVELKQIITSQTSDRLGGNSDAKEIVRYEKLDHDYNDDDKFSKKTPKANPRNARPQSFTFTPQLLMAACVTVVLLFGLLFVLGGGAAEEEKELAILAESLGKEPLYSVVIDAGSTGTRVHVFKFLADPSGVHLDLQEEVFEAIKPGFRAYANNPNAAADSLDPLLSVVHKHVPENMRATTPMTLRATAGLRLLPEGPDAARAIMESVTVKLQAAGLYVHDDYISVLSGDDEGVYGWLAVNYLLGKLGKPVPQTVAMMDMGGGSMQMAYAVEDSVAAEAPLGYVRPVTYAGYTYNLYVKSYPGYGIMAARAKILQRTRDMEGTHACVPQGYEGGCASKCYGLQPHESYVAVGRADGANWNDCMSATLLALNTSMDCGVENQCSFAGVWAPDLPTGMTVYGMSYFYERPMQAKATHPSAADAEVTLSMRSLLSAGKKVCSVAAAQLGAQFPDSEEDHREYLCLDVAYQYSLLTKGFNLNPDSQRIELVAKIPFHGEAVEAAWSLGDALEVMGDLLKTTRRRQ